MDNQNVTLNKSTEQPAAADNAGQIVFVRSQLKRSYGTGTSAMGVMLVFILIIGGIASIYTTSAAALGETANNYITTILTLFASPVGITAGLLFGYKSLKAFKFKDTFNTPFRGKALVFGLFAALGIQGVMIFLIDLMTKLTGYSGMPEQVAQQISFGDDPVMNVIIFIYVVLVGPVFEELICRGFLLASLAPVDRHFAMIVSALMFSLMHGNFAQIPNTFLVGLVWAYLALKTGSIIPTIIAHIIMNANAMIPGLIYSTEDQVTIHYIVSGSIGLVCLAFYLIKNRRLEDEDMTVPAFKVNVPKTADNTWKLLVRCPSFWIVSGYYIFNAFVMLAMSKVS